MPSKEFSKFINSELFKGLVLNPSQIAKDINSANLCSNVEKNKKGQLTVRKGTKFNFRKVVTAAYELLFPFTYSYHDTATGGTVEELVALKMAMTNLFAQVAPVLYRIVEGTVTITYSGAGTGTLSILPEVETATYPNSYRLKVTTNGVTVLNETAQSANSNGSGGLLSSYIADIDALTSWAASPSSLPSSANLAYLDVVGRKSVSLTNGQTTTLTYYDLQLKGTGANAPLLITDANFVPPSFQNFENILDVAYGSSLYKYDGVNFYQQGLPQAAMFSAADNGSGTSKTSGATYIYKVLYSRKDGKSNIIEGEDSDDTTSGSSYTTVNTHDLGVTFTTLRTIDYPNYAIHGAKSSTLNTLVNTITVTAGHGMIVGDTAYFFDNNTGVYVERLVTAIGATTITVAGSPVTVLNNQYISNNVRVQIWRTKANGTDFYFVDEVPNWYNTTFYSIYVDTKTDAQLTEPFTEQLRKHSLPPDSYYVGEHQGLKIVAGDPNNPNRVRWALPDASEGFPLESNLTDIKAGGLGAITGFGTVDDDNLAVFKETGHVLLDGTLDDLNFRVLNRSSTGIGCTAFRTLANIGDGNALTGLSLYGPFLFNNKVPELLLSESIRPIFDQKQGTQVNGTVITDANGNAYSFTTLNTNFRVVLKRAMGFNDYLAKKYHLYLPAEVGTPQQGKYVDPLSSKWLVFDYANITPFWTEYTFYNRYRPETLTGAQQPNMNAAQGFTLYKNNLWFGMQGSYSLTIHGRLYSFKNDGTKYDYEEAGYPVYMDIHFTPFTRDEGSLSAFFKPLKVLLTRFINNLLTDPAVTNDFGDNFSITLKGINNYRDYAGTTTSFKAARTFNVANGSTSILAKVPNTKARSFQLLISNESADPLDYEVPAFDQIEFVYATPFDRQVKEPKQSG